MAGVTLRTDGLPLGSSPLGVVHQPPNHRPLPWHGGGKSREGRRATYGEDVLGEAAAIWIGQLAAPSRPLSPDPSLVGGVCLKHMIMQVTVKRGSKTCYRAKQSVRIGLCSYTVRPALVGVEQKGALTSSDTGLAG